MDDPVANKNDQCHSGANHSEKESAEKTADVLARRRLLKGAMATAPAIFTLQSGAARAALSNMQCLANSPEFSPEKNLVHVGYNKDQSEKPNWQRNKVPAIKVKNADAKAYQLVEVPQSYTLNKQYQDKYGRTWVAFEINDGTAGYVLDGQQNDVRIHDIYNSYHKTYFFTLNRSTNRYQVFAVDQNGNYVNGLDKGNPVTASCWTSFAYSTAASKTSWWRKWA